MDAAPTAGWVCVYYCTILSVTVLGPAQVGERTGTGKGGGGMFPKIPQTPGPLMGVRAGQGQRLTGC